MFKRLSLQDELCHLVKEIFENIVYFSSFYQETSEIPASGRENEVAYQINVFNIAHEHASLKLSKPQCCHPDRQRAIHDARFMKVSSNKNDENDQCPRLKSKFP